MHRFQNCFRFWSTTFRYGVTFYACHVRTTPFMSFSFFQFCLLSYPPKLRRFFTVGLPLVGGLGSGQAGGVHPSLSEDTPPGEGLHQPGGGRHLVRVRRVGGPLHCLPPGRLRGSCRPPGRNLPPCCLGEGLGGVQGGAVGPQLLHPQPVGRLNTPSNKQ